MISYHGLDGFPPGGMFSYRAVGNQPTLVRFLTGRLDFIPDPLVGLDVAVSNNGDSGGVGGVSALEGGVNPSVHNSNQAP